MQLVKLSVYESKEPEWLSRHLVGLHDGVGLKVGRLLHEAADQQHGLALGLQQPGVRQRLVVRETLGHALLQHNQSLVHVSLGTENGKWEDDIGSVHAFMRLINTLKRYLIMINIYERNGLI